MENLDINSRKKMLELYKYMIVSRESDIVELELVNSGEANFLASSRGHEGSAILASCLTPADWLHCHYRDKALMLARGVTNEMFFYSALCKAESSSYGRQMVSHMSDRRLNIMSIVGPVGNNALQAAGVAHVIKNQLNNPIVICAMGDGTSQQGEVMEAIAEAKRSQLPILFFIHNNNLAISTRTQGQTFFSLPDNKLATSFYDVPISYLDGMRPLEQLPQIEALINGMRIDRGPQIIVFNVHRLDNHSNADNQKLYRDDDELSHVIKYDPLVLSREFLIKSGFTDSELDNLIQEVKSEVREALNIARSGTNPVVCFSAEKELPRSLHCDAYEYRGTFIADEKRLTMLDAMKQVFRYQLAKDSSVFLFGEDIEDDKGDVFGITRGLSTDFPNQVKNSPLSEATIIGVSIGMSLAGKRPVAFMQFADFIPVGYNQIFTELATMYWRTNGEWECPVIIFAACGGYRPGLGPFHSQTNEATFAHIPGIDVYMPSNAADAAGMLNAAFQSGRPSVFLYPKKLLNNNDISDTTSGDVEKHIIPVGVARIVKPGSDITLVGWGNTVSLCIDVAKTLEQIEISTEIIDLRMIKPYDLKTILLSVKKTKNLVVVHEDNYTCGMAGEIIAALTERIDINVKMRRVTRSDTYVPCNFDNQLEVLPSHENILTVIAEMLDLSLDFEVQQKNEDGYYIVDVLGASPSDETVLINKVHVKVGDLVKQSDILVDIEASKSAGEILAPYAGIVEEIYVFEEKRAVVGNPLLKMRLTEQNLRMNKQSVQKKPVLTRKKSIKHVLSTESNRGIYTVGMSIPHFKTGSRKVTNLELIKYFPNVSEEDVFKRTGIESRYWLAEGESISDIATTVVVEAFNKSNLHLFDIDLIICATCTPEKYQSPSMACLVLEKLYHIYGEHSIQAYDINAACSGYLYALQNAKNYLQTRPDEKVLLITLESLSTRLNLADFDTAFLFGDGATATILYGENHINKSKFIVDESVLTSIAEDGDTLNVPLDVDKGISLRGKRLFNSAVKNMAKVMHKCCEKNGITLDQIELVIPHQANQRILTAVERKLGLMPGLLYSNIASYGNTSSCSIPIALAEAVNFSQKYNNKQDGNRNSGHSIIDTNTPGRIALCAFGGGFTAGATILTVYHE